MSDELVMKDIMNKTTMQELIEIKAEPIRQYRRRKHLLDVCLMIICAILLCIIVAVV